jgi:hypothetical protein
VHYACAREIDNNSALLVRFKACPRKLIISVYCQRSSIPYDLYLDALKPISIAKYKYT